MGFMFTSCGDSLKDSIIKDIDEYFTEAERVLGEFDNAEDFVAFAEAMNDRGDLLEYLQEKYGDKTITEKDGDAINTFVEERATAYNKAEAETCAKFLTPAIDHFETILNKMYPQFQAGTPFDEETLDEFLDAYFGVTKFSECENIYPELSERLEPLFDMEDEMSEVIIARMDQLWPEEE